jgi:hypothetical protein
LTLASVSLDDFRPSSSNGKARLCGTVIHSRSVRDELNFRSSTPPSARRHSCNTSYVSTQFALRLVRHACQS